MEFIPSKPIYIQIKEYYESLIDSGVLKEGDEMPSVREIAIAFGVNPNTVQRALSLMVESNYLRSIPKKGFFVNKVKPSKNKIIKNCIDYLKSQGVNEKDIIDYLKGEKHD